MPTLPWHQLCKLREDVRTGRLTLAEFAADLNAVRTGDAPEVYKDPVAFFSRTYPTYNMKTLVRDVLQRLSGQGGKPVLRIQVAYGGGKTHTLITLLHLAESGSQLAGNATVKEFLDFAGVSQSPRARVALLPFDQFDVKEGLVVHGPDGQKRRVMTPWGALAYQLGGDAAFTRVMEHERDYTPPAEPILVDLLRLPQRDGLATLILIDEAVWYYRQAVNAEPRRLGIIKDFYQVLIQATGKVERAAMVASIIASKIEAADHTGTECLSALEYVFGRMEEIVEPVVKEDLAEVMRRRLFASVAGKEECRPAVDALMAGLQTLPVRSAQKDQQAYNRLLEDYPFHPDLIEVLYQKWTQLSGFQRTRGALRLLAYALREQDGLDPSPVVGPGVLLAKGEGVSSAISELIKVTEEKGEWTAILHGELDKAKEVQADFPTLKAGEIEQAVLAIFLHSQPMGQKADSHDLYALLAHPQVDAAALTEGLARWRGRSWFLKDDPDIWALGTTPNLTRMQHWAMERLPETEIDAELRKRVQVARELIAADEGVRCHLMPLGPSNISDDVELHYVILGPECPVDPSKPLPQKVIEYFTTTSGPQNPRTYRNSLVALAPDFSKLAGLREQVRRFLAWKSIETGSEFNLLTDVQKKELPRRKTDAQNNLPEQVHATYSILLAVNEQGQVAAQVISSDRTLGTPFQRIKLALAEQERMLTTTLDPELLLPGSYLELWAAGEQSKRVKDLIAAFAQFPRLPRLLRPQVMYDTLVRGVINGTFVLRLVRSDGSVRTIWRTHPTEDDLARAELEVVPPAYAELHDLEPALLVPGQLEGLWPSLTDPVKVSVLGQFFDGQRAPRLASSIVLDKAIHLAVQRGSLMARDATKSYLKEYLPGIDLPPDLELLLPPPPVRGADLSPRALPEVWTGETAALTDLAAALAKRRGSAVPWVLLADGVSEALANRIFELASLSPAWPCAQEQMGLVHLRLVEIVIIEPEELVGPTLQDVWAQETPTLGAIKEALEKTRGRAIPQDLFLAATIQAANRHIIEMVDPKSVHAPTLASRVRQSQTPLFAEAQLSARQVQDFADIVGELLRLAPELDFTFRLTVTAQGERPTQGRLEQINALLRRVKEEWWLE